MDLEDGRGGVDQELLGDQKGDGEGGGVPSQRRAELADTGDDEPDDEGPAEPAPPCHPGGGNGAEERGDPADGEDQPLDARRDAEVAGQVEEEDDAEDAEREGEREVGAGQGAQDRVPDDQSQPFGRLNQDVAALLARGGGRFGCLDPPDEERGGDEGDRVDQDRERGGQKLDQPAAGAEGRHLGDGGGYRELAVAFHQLLAVDEGGQ